MSTELTRAVATLRAAYPNQNLPAETVAVYAYALNDLEPELVTEAVASLVRSSRFFPTVAEIRERIAETVLGLPSPLQAWLEAEQRAVGMWDGRGRHPMVTDALNAVGGVWAVKTSENPIATRAQFLKFYGELRSHQISLFVQSGSLPAHWVEADNRIDHPDQEDTTA